MQFTARWAALVLLSFLVSACGTPKVLVGLNAADSINPGEAGEPLPVVVRFYQLRESGPFERAGFEELWVDGEAVLGDTLLSTQELMVEPGAETRISLRRESKASQLGVVALFRDWEGTQWRTTTALPGGALAGVMSVVIRVDIEDRSVTARR